MPTDVRTGAAEKFSQAATELRSAADHLDTAAGHFRAGEVPRGCAHALAAEGHMIVARRLIDENAVTHSTRSRP